MAHTTGDHTQHLERLHAHRRNVHAVAAQLAEDAARVVTENNTARPGSETITGPFRAGNETRYE